jgi:hypothetical protein
MSSVLAASIAIQLGSPSKVAPPQDETITGRCAAGFDRDGARLVLQFREQNRHDIVHGLKPRVLEVAHIAGGLAGRWSFLSLGAR